MLILNSKDFGKAIKQRRKELKVTQVQLSAMANVGPRFIGELEKGKATIELEKALYVAWMLDINIEMQKK
ncbi:MAG: helix-turn-helix domain-containing protein [Alphaproteobacteria bacterium]|nr:helix-turn-helix domain-containing protein [Alphaproteobacteria bacterium]